MDNYFLVGYIYDKPVSLSPLGRRATSRKAVSDFYNLKGHIMRHNDKLTSLALYRGLCWSMSSFVSGHFDLVEWR